MLDGAPTVTVLDLLVVGAGPVGLTAALCARTNGLSVAVIEAEHESSPRPGSRALFVHRVSLELLERASPGLGRRIGDYGIVWTARRTLYRGREVYARSFPARHGDSLPPYTSLRQPDTERLIRAACTAGGVPVTWGAPLLDLTVTADVVHVRAAGRQWRARYVIGADGGRSATRNSIGVVLDGERSTAHHVVVDVADHPSEPAATERVFHYHHPAMAGRHVLVVPFRGGCQVDVQCRDGEDPAELESQVERWLPLVLGRAAADRIMCVSRYPFLQRVAERFTDPHRRVLLAGDAAHLFAPFGARGMNSGFADAEAAVRAVAHAVCVDESQAGIAVDGFDRLRRHAAYHNRAAAGAALRHMRPRARSACFAQDLAALLSPVLPRAGRWLENAPYGPRDTGRAGQKY